MLASPLADVRQALHAQRDAAIQTWRRQPRSDLLLHRLSASADEALRRLLILKPLPEGATLAAVGGYGRGELYPGSDVDVLILLACEPDASGTQRIQDFVAALWDLGLHAAHSVRTLEQCLHMAREDVTVQTAVLEARRLAGNAELMRTLEERLRAELDPARFFLAKRAEMQRRHAHFQDTPYALEPNCKESPGALRDLHLLQWVSRAAGYGDRWTAIMRSGLITVAQLRALRRAQAAFRRLRVELHLLTGRAEDRLRFDLQPALAAIYGFQPTRHRQASELLMQRYYWAAHVISQLTDMLMRAIEEDLFAPAGPAIALDGDFCIVHGRLDLRREDALERNPSLIFRAFLHVQQHESLDGMRAGLLRALWHARGAIDAQFRRNPVNRRLFLRILMQRRGAARALRDMSRLNILPRYLPAFRRIVGLMQHDLFHAYTVDEHTLRLISLLDRCADDRHSHEYPLASQLMAGLERPWVLTIAALFHDIAKGRGGDHANRGAQLARDFCASHRVGAHASDLVHFLVREHLSLSRVAQKQDLSDPEVIHAFAARVGDRERLQTLYLLTMADIRATSPRTWNTWKGKLLDELYQKADIVLGGERPDARAIVAQRMQIAARETQALGVTSAQREALWQSLDITYFLRHETHEISWHLKQLAARLHDEAPVVRARVVGRDEALQVLVYTPDRKDLFASICAYFERETLSIQEARIHTTRNGWALDSFIVLHTHHAVRYDTLIGTVQRELAAHLQRHEIDQKAGRDAPRRARPASRKRTAMRQAQVFPLAPGIALTPGTRGEDWTLSIVCADRPGLLHMLARILADHGIRLKMAKIHTLGERAEDVFIIDGTLLDHLPGRLQLERALLNALAP
ncbi:MAG: [protein-PII] uridylyltransferase [Castellaniella sp.]